MGSNVNVKACAFSKREPLSLSLLFPTVWEEYTHFSFILVKVSENSFFKKLKTLKNLHKNHFSEL